MPVEIHTKIRVRNVPVEVHPGQHLDIDDPNNVVKYNVVTVKCQVCHKVTTWSELELAEGAISKDFCHILTLLDAKEKRQFCGKACLMAYLVGYEALEAPL